MSSDVPPGEGFARFRGYRTWYRVLGAAAAPGRLPLVLAHGGPGGSHDYLEPLAALAQQGRQVVFYDQLGCGNSDHPHDPALCTVETYVAELEALRLHLGFERFHLLGQSWGGLLALEYAAAHPQALAGLILADPIVSVDHWLAEGERLLAEMPADIRATIVRHEAAGTTDSEDYQAAVMAYYRRHVCRRDPWPACLERMFARIAADPFAYQTMWGPNEFRCSGTLAGWDPRPRLGAITAPALIVGGRHDEATPAIQEDLQRRLPGSRWVVFEESSHMPFLEETDRFLEVVGAFLVEVEGA